MVKPKADAGFCAKDNIIIGNVALYGATSGKAFICHSNCLADAEATKAAVEAAFPHLNGEVRICDIGTIVASHSGPGTVAAFFFGDDRAPEGSAV